MQNISKKQHGMATITISIVLLIMMTMGVIFSANVGIMEKKISSNEVRSSEAMLSAQAGIDYTLATLSQFLLSAPTAPFTINGNFIQTTSDQAITYHDGIVNKTTGFYNVSIDTTLPEYPNVLTIVSQGKSSDQSASVTITQKTVFASPMLGVIEEENSILNKAVLIVDGSAEIDSSKINNVDNINNTQSSTIKVWATQTATDTVPSPAAGVLDNNAQLIYNNTHPLDQIFLENMRKNADQGIRHISNRTQCTTACTNPPELLNSPESKMHYLEGDVTISGLTLGTADYPVIIVADLTSGSQLQISNSTINGLLLIKGNWNNSNNTATVNGAIVLETGNLTNGNNLSINYSATVYSNLKRVGIYARSPGSWNDIN